MKKRPKTNAAAARKSTDVKSHSRARRAVTKHAASKAPLQYVPWHTIPLEELNPLLQRQFVVGQEIMLARVLLKKAALTPSTAITTNNLLTFSMER